MTILKKYRFDISWATSDSVEVVASSKAAAEDLIWNTPISSDAEDNLELEVDGGCEINTYRFTHENGSQYIQVDEESLLDAFSRVKWQLSRDCADVSDNSLGWVSVEIEETPYRGDFKVISAPSVTGVDVVLEGVSVIEEGAQNVQ